MPEYSIETENFLMKIILIKGIHMKKIMIKKLKKYTVKLIFKAYKKTDKIFFYNFFPIYENVNRLLSKKGSWSYQDISRKEKNKKRQYAHD